MEVLFSVKILDIEFSPDLYFLRSPKCKKEVSGNWSLRMYVWLQGEYLVLYIFKTNTDRNTKFYTQYKTGAYIIFSGFEENWKAGSKVGQTGSEYLKNGSNDFLQIW